MKLLWDFFPIVVFFGAFKWAEQQREAAAAWATAHLSWMTAQPAVAPEVAPMLLATVAVVLATVLQVVVQRLRGQTTAPSVWLGLVLVVVMGGATVWFQSETFIKWKPTVLYGLLATALVLGPWVFKRNPIQALLGAQLTLPAAVWARLNWAWALFFVVMAGLNLWVAYRFSTDTWVNFKLFGGLGLMLAFTLVQAWLLAPYLKEDPSA